MLIETYNLDVFTPTCDAKAVRYAARAHLACDISDVLPFLNATLRGAVYLPQAQALTWKKAGHSIAFHACEIAVSNVEDREEAQTELKGVIDLVTRAWEQRSEITPSSVPRQRPAPMALYKLLPQTNCHLCGERSCYYFALKLATSQKRLAECPVLAEPQYAEQSAALSELVIDAPGVG